MDNTALFSHIERLVGLVEESTKSFPEVRGAQAQVKEFLAEFAGPKSSFAQLAQTASGTLQNMADTLVAALENYRSYVESGLQAEVSPARRAQLDVVSDFLEQAQVLLQAKSVHPAAPIVLVGATLEEFLRTWVEAEGIGLGQRKPSLDTYTQLLFAESKITKQDVKDLTAWGGLRNHAAHGEWAEVSDKQRANLMLEGVNLFMRKYGAE